MAIRLILSLIILTTLAGAQAVLSPPFGMKWGDSPDRILDWAGEHQLDIQMTIPAAQPDMRIFRLEGEGKTLPDSKATALEARYLKGQLIEVTVHHAGNGLSAESVEARFNLLKRQLVAEHGAMTANQQKNLVEDDFVTRTVSYHREPVRGLFLMMTYTEVEDRLRKKRKATFSLLYRNDNLRQRLE